MTRLLAAVAVVVAGLPLGGCGTINTALTDAIGEHLPTWAGGLPEGAPPRPGDPRYAEFERAQNERRGIKPTDVAAQPASAPAQSPRNAAAPAPSPYRLDGKAIY